MMVGVVDVGGGLRGVYGAGVFDRCIDENIRFDYCIGVSAGSANIASYTAGQRGRNYRFFTDYTFRKEYMSLSNFIHSGSYLGLDYIYSTLTNQGGEDPLDFKTMSEFNGVIKTVATNALTGQPQYFGIDDYSLNDYGVLKASCALPVVCKPVSVGGVAYFDGGIADPVPIEKAFTDGCDKLVLILTKPLAQIPEKNPRNELTARLLKRNYPKLSESLCLMQSRYNDSIRKALEYQKQGRVLIIAPDDCCGMKTLTKDREKIDRLYTKGYENAAKIKEFVRL
ncbi:MAG: patatin family protein [Clostridia bacterium]|nr:patatin family protein [Clostridia bacterium]